MPHVRRFDHVGLTVADLDVVTAFFVALCADLTFDHAGERAVTDGGAVVGHMALLAQQSALV